MKEMAAIGSKVKKNNLKKGVQLKSICQGDQLERIDIFRNTSKTSVEKHHQEVDGGLRKAKKCCVVKKIPACKHTYRDGYSCAWIAGF